jgi:hypothetical protein
MMINRRDAGVEENFNVYFVLIRNTFAYFAPWRELIVFSLAEARGSQRTSMFNLFLVLRPGESLFVFFSRKGAKVAKYFHV